MNTMKIILDGFTTTQLLSKINAQTAELARLYENSDDSCLSVTGRQAKAAVKDAKFDPACEKKVLSIVSAVVGEDLSKAPSKRITFVPYAAVVCMRNRNDHNYAIWEPVLMVVGEVGKSTGMRAMRQDGVIGNLLPSLRKRIRPATRKEVAWLVERLKSTPYNYKRYDC